MPNYVEEYVIVGRSYKIEDSGGGGFNDSTRFRCWAGGCAICLGHDSIEPARRHLIDYTTEWLRGECEKSRAKHTEYQTALINLERKGGRLGPRSNNLIPFLVASKEKIQARAELLKDVLEMLRQSFPNEWQCLMNEAEIKEGIPLVRVKPSHE